MNLSSPDYFNPEINNVVFLDIDGVLNHMNTKCDYKFEAESIEALNELFYEHKINIVLSSSWREAFPFSFLQKLFQDNGIQAPLIDKTPIFIRKQNAVPEFNLFDVDDIEVDEIYTREYEIRKWLEIFKPKHYLILDDFKMKDETLFKHQVWTNYFGDDESDMAFRKKHLPLCYKILEMED